MSVKKPKFFIIFLRISMGWLFLYQGIQAIVNPAWNIVPLIQNATTFPGLYTYILSPDILPLTLYVLRGLYILVGICCVLGIFVRPAALLGMLVSAFFYFPRLNFPYVGDMHYIVNEYFIYFLVFGYLFMSRAGEFFGFGSFFKVSRY